MWGEGEGTRSRSSCPACVVHRCSECVWCPGWRYCRSLSWYLIRKTSNLSLVSLSLESASLTSSLRTSIFGMSLARLCLWQVIFVFVNPVFVSLKNRDIFTNEICLKLLWESKLLPVNGQLKYNFMRVVIYILDNIGFLERI